MMLYLFSVDREWDIKNNNLLIDNQFERKIIFEKRQYCDSVVLVVFKMMLFFGVICIKVRFINCVSNDIYLYFVVRFLILLL